MFIFNLTHFIHLCGVTNIIYQTFVFSENLVAIEMRKLEVKFNNPICVSMHILDISKTCLYEFHHDYMLPMYHEKCKVMYTDTALFISSSATMYMIL